MQVVESNTGPSCCEGTALTTPSFYPQILYYTDHFVQNKGYTFFYSSAKFTKVVDYLGRRELRQVVTSMSLSAVLQLQRR